MTAHASTRLSIILLLFMATIVPARSQEVGSAMLCDTADQIAAVVESDSADEAVQVINRASPHACGMIAAAYYRGHVKETVKAGSLYDITPVLVIGLPGRGGTIAPVKPLVQWGAFPSSLIDVRWKPEYAGSPYSTWFAQQHNSKGEWCCDQSDAERYDGDYTMNEDGSVTLHLAVGDRRIQTYMVLKTPNPTGHAVWWHMGATDFCFSPGSLI